MSPGGHQLHRGVEVLTLVDPGADDGQLAPEDPEQVDLPRVEWIATMTSRPRTASAWVAVVTPPAEPETSNATSAPAPPVQSSIDAMRSARRVEHAQAERRADRPAGLVEFQHHDVGADGPGGQGDQQADRAATDDDDLLAGAHAAPADVVHRDRGRLDQRRAFEREVRWAAPRARRPGPSTSDCIEPVESMPRKFSRWQMWRVPALAGGHSPHQSSGMTVTGSPMAQPATSGPSSAMRPDISWPITAGR